MSHLPVSTAGVTMSLTLRNGRHRAAALLLAVAALFMAAPPPALSASAASLAALGASQGDEFLHPDVAFRVAAEAVAPDRVEVLFQVHEGYYLYRSKMKFQAGEVDNAGLGNVDLPDGEDKTDEYFGRQEVYHSDVIARLPVSRGELSAFVLPLQVTYQGCADAGLCYPPITRTFDVQMPRAKTVSSFAALAAGGSGSGGFVSKQDALAGLIRDGNVLLMAGAFFLAGLALAFTPCVLPMVPIVAGIIAGQGPQVTRMRAFSLSLAYVLGMAATYTLAGVGFAAAGQQAQTLFQQPWIILLFSALFVAMALSMFGLYTVQMPTAIQSRLSQLSSRQRGGHHAGVALMGALSALIVTTCVGPALVAALSVIGQSGQVARGGGALFAMAMGMGVPLLVVGASAGQLLPRAGTWMDTVKQAFGALMLAVAVWMLSRILPGRITLLLWAIPPAALAVILLHAAGRSGKGRLFLRLAGTAAALYALLIGAGYLRGATDPLRPLQVAQAQETLPFERIKSLEELQARVAAASAAGRPVMLDFYADWCVSCKEMERYTFPQQPVRDALGDTVWLQADVTANDATDQALLRHFGIYGPPTIAFYGADGEERRQYRVVGFMKAAEFAPLAAQALDPLQSGS